MGACRGVCLLNAGVWNAQMSSGDSGVSSAPLGHPLQGFKENEHIFVIKHTGFFENFHSRADNLKFFRGKC